LKYAAVPPDHNGCHQLLPSEFFHLKTCDEATFPRRKHAASITRVFAMLIFTTCDRFAITNISVSRHSRACRALRFAAARCPAWRRWRGCRQREPPQGASGGFLHYLGREVHSLFDRTARNLFAVRSIPPPRDLTCFECNASQHQFCVSAHHASSACGTNITT
jgi:hypothetical protein